VVVFRGAAKKQPNIRRINAPGYKANVSEGGDDFVVTFGCKNPKKDTRYGFAADFGKD
jgi:hypothetical protein